MHYTYTRPSAMTDRGLELATSGGTRFHVDEPHFFSGFVENPHIVARGVLTVADYAAKRFYTPVNTVALAALDPVVCGSNPSPAAAAHMPAWMSPILTHNPTSRA